MAYATNLGLRRMADICNLSYQEISTAAGNYIRLETLKEANDRIANAAARLPISRHFDIDEAVHSSSDGQKFEAAIPTINARHSAKYFGLNKGVVAYTLLANHVPLNARIIGANEHESHFVFDILFNNATDILPAMHSTDTHGANQVNFALLHLFGYRFAPRYRNVRGKVETGLYGFPPPRHYEKDNPNTLAAYQREIERFLLWLGLARGKALSEATGEDIALFDDLLQFPERWPQWYGAPRPRRDPNWKPWSGRLSARSRLGALAVVNRCYRWLVAQGYLRLNPVEAAGIRLRQARAAPVQERFLDAGLWQAVRAQVEAMPRATPSQQARYHRTRWVIMALYGMLARASEFTSARMGDLVQVRRPSGTQWWWQVRGKHRSEADAPDAVPVPPALMDELSLYRAHLGLSPLPAPDEATPMVVSLYPQRDVWAALNRTTL